MTNNYSYFPLTYSQKNIYKTEITYPGTSIGIITATMRIVDDDIDFDKMEKALNLIIEHNDSMRIRIKMIDREPRQYFCEYKYEKYEVIDLRHEPIQKLYDFDEKQTEKPMHLLESQLYKFTLLWLSEGEFAVFLKIHHLISDGWSTVRIGNYILDYYEKLQKGIEIAFDKVPSYKEYILDENEYLSGPLFLRDKEFWHEKFKDACEPSMIKPRKSNLMSIDAVRRTFALPDRLVEQLRQYCRETRTSIFGVILSAFAIYLNRTTHRNDITIGTLVLNRSSRRQKNTVGMFISTVPIKVEFESDMNYTEFNKLLTREWMSVLKHQRYPFELLLKDVREENKNVKDLFDIVFSYQNASFTENTSSKERTSRWHFNHAQKESLTIHVHDRDDVGKLLLDYDYLTSLFYEKEIEFIHDNFIRILWHALDNPAKPMSDLELISEDEKHRILFDFNSASAEFDPGQTFADLLDMRVSDSPEKTALICGNEKLTYKQLDELSNSLANKIIKAGAKPEDIVCLMADKSIRMIVALIAIVKSGAAYLCVESDLPANRKKFMLKDSGAKMLIANKSACSGLGFGGSTMYIEDDGIFSEPSDKPAVKILPGSLAYIIYTSGTSGEPKGVLIEHKSLVNYIYGFLKEFKYTGSETVLQQSSYSFDAFVEEVYPTLAAGASLVIANKYGAKDMKKLAETIEKHDVNIVSVSPLVLNELNKMGGFESIDLYISGGDVLKYEYMDKLIEKADVYNTYGPTETTVCATYHRCNGVTANIPIGKPVANYRLFILDKNLNLLPIGVPGEIYISGPGLARGYHKRPELTEKAFIENPFMPGEKMYRTNDIGRWYPMGEIEFVGRADNQIKIRGMRIEPGEIESQMLGHAKIKSAVVAVKEDGERKMLCAYYEVTEDISVQEIRSYLRSKLPLHMVPSYYLKMDKLPLSAGGKVNRAALPGVNNMIFNEGSEYVKPGDETEEKLAVIVQNLLNRKRISMKDNFFDLGGDSLSLTTLVFDIIDNFGIDIPLEYFFRANDIKEIADLIKESSDSHGDKKDARDLILIHKGILGAKDIFLIHDGIGGIGAYFDLAEYLDEYNVWGIRAESEFGIWPQNLDIEALAESYAGRIIEKSSPPYNIGGWCIGGTIAFETARQLEKMDCKVETLLILDTIPPMRWKGAQRFSVEGEKKFISENIGHGGLTKYIKDADQIQELWQKTVESIDSSIYREDIINNFISRIPEDIKQYLEEYHTYTAGEIFLFINRLRTFHISRALYFPKGKVGADVLCFQAADNSVAEDSTIWDGYSSGRIEHIMISGDHNTMLKSNGAKSIAKVIKDRVK